jgi:hypothetical protein
MKQAISAFQKDIVNIQISLYLPTLIQHGFIHDLVDLILRKIRTLEIADLDMEIYFDFIRAFFIAIDDSGPPQNSKVLMFYDQFKTLKDRETKLRLKE